ncbi:MAG TPA: hypothetical protein VKA34_00860 [Balneolales bacterium]|nr:hypothetical protein [Balneolales bacterium]
MIQSSVRLPVIIPDLSYGLKEAVGLLKADNQHIILELQEQDALVGAYKTGVNTYKIAWKDIDSIELDKGLFSSSLIISAKSMSAIEDIPGNKQGQCIFKISRKDKKNAEKTISVLNLHLSEIRLEELDDSEDEEL